MTTEAEDLNGVNVAATAAFQDAVRANPARADRNPTVVARWLDGGRSEVSCDGAVATIGGDDELNPMRMLLGTLAACDVDLVAMHAALLGVRLEGLEVEAQGYFNVQRYMGLEAPIGSGYQSVRYVVRVNAPTATEEQLSRLRELCERGSPVGDTLERAIPLTLSFEAGP
jgi:uncharacterized OsmC-like protein